MKRGSVGFIFLIAAMNFVSAYNGYYGGFSLADLLSEIDASTMTLGVVFVVAFALINFSLTRAFKDNKSVAGVIAFCISLFITWGLNRSGFELDNLLYSVGVPSDFLFALLPLIIIGVLIGIGLKWGFGKALVVVGVLFILTSLLVYEKGAAFSIGIVFIFIGIVVWVKWPKKNNP